MSDAALWVPSQSRIDSSLVDQFRRHLCDVTGLELRNTRDLHRYSCDMSGKFWREIWEFAGLVGAPGDTSIAGSSFPATEFFPNGTVDVAATMLAGDPSEIVAIECDETGTIDRIDRAELIRRTAALKSTLSKAGVTQGDVVAGYATTSLATLVTMLASAACGAVYTTASAEFGADAVIDRFSQVQPKVLLATPGYTFAGRHYDVVERVGEVVGALQSIELVLTVDASPSAASPNVPNVLPRRGVSWLSYTDATSDTSPLLETTLVPFNAPGSILYSSGTTGKPKCIVHRAGGVLLKHLSEQLLHCDIRRGDRLFYYTTPSWMMWNWLVSGLAAGACVVLYSGSPLAPNQLQLLEMAERERVTYFGTSPAYLDALRRSDIDVANSFDLSSVRTIAVTGAPLSPATARYAGSWGNEIHILSKSGGTDLCGGLLTGDPTTPVWEGEIQAPALGCDIAIVDDNGHDVEPGTTGELVSRTPFPSMPISFVGDDGTRLRATYYDRFPGCWHQADFVSETPHGGYIVHGRSDTTLNANGVRIGTAEIYAQLERIPWISAAIAVEHRTGETARVVLLLETDPNDPP